MEVKKIVEGMTAVEVAEVIDSNFKNQNKILEEDIATQNSVIGVSEYKDFSEAEAVNVGDVRKYEGFLYECVEATTGAFDASKWKKSSFKAETEKKLSELGSYVSNPEYARAYTDREGKILWAIKTDGSIYYGANVPQQIVNYIEEKISLLVTDVNTALITKVDKEAGNSLIDADYASSQSAIENSEYLEVETDQTDKVIEGTKKDGTKEINVPVSLRSAKIDSAESPEYISVETDNSGKVLSGTKQDGSHYSHNLHSETIDAKVDKEEGKELISSEIVETIGFKESVEYIYVETDVNGKVLGGRQADGKQFENIGHNIGGTELLPFDDNDERSEIVVDESNNIISYRDKKGIKHEEAGLDAKFVLSDANKKTLYEILKSLGYNFMDWSNATRLEIDIPKCAYINIICVSGWATTKTQNILAEVEFYDMRGNYFRKYIIFNAQGSSSLLLPKKNASLDLYVTKEDAINDENTFEVKFGNWLAFDSYHIKAYYSDQFKCCNPVCYKLYQQISDTKGIYNDRIWKRALLDFSELGPVPGEEGSVFNSNLIFDEALGHPDGFPCIAYLNGEFYGVYSWQIKKHRDNYKQDKAKATNIHLDIYQTDNSLWAEPSIKWSFQEAGNTKLPIEIRNPKNLYYKELHWVKGKNTLEYDGDYPYEIAGSTEVESWIENKQLPDGTWPSKPKDEAKLITNLRITAQVKDYILTLSDYVREMQAAAAIYEASEKTAEDLATLKAAFEERFDKESIIDYIITIDLGGVTDSVTNNVQWLTYDGVKWFASPYDMDRSFRQGGTGGPYNEHVAYGGSYPVNTLSPITLFCKYYEDELDARYKELADKGIASVDGIFSIFKKWINAVGSNNYILDADKWKEGEITDNMYRLHKFIEEEIFNMDSVYSYTRN